MHNPRLTRLEDKRVVDLYIPAITRRLDTLLCTNQRTYHQARGRADITKGAKLESHGEGGWS